MVEAPLSRGSLRGAEVHQAQDVLARAFFDNPLIQHVLPDADHRLPHLLWFMGQIIGHVLRRGELYRSGDPITGVAAWLPPSEAGVTLPQLIRAGALMVPLHFGLAGTVRYLSYLAHCQRLEKRAVPGPHWYLSVIGVDPASQGQGVGGALMQPVLKKADSGGLACYLETDKESSLAFYRKHGFEVEVAGAVPGGGPRFWTMIREPHQLGR